jgi:hypothetical protein
MRFFAAGRGISVEIRAVVFHCQITLCGLHLAPGSCSVAAKSSCLGGTMRAIVALYLVIGVVLLVIGFLLPGPCPNPNLDVVTNIVFVLTWPVGLYAEVYQGQLSAQQWLHRQACEGGGKLGQKKPAPI